jgi:cell wall-associated NlpC family hydrolase
MMGKISLLVIHIKGDGNRLKKILAAAFAALLFSSIGTAAHAQHYVEKNESLAKIAKAYNMKLNDLISLNPHIKNPNIIKPGDYIVIRSNVEKQADIVDYAKSLQYTTAYVYGGQHFPTATDCSGFVQGVYKKFGITLPRVSKDQANTGKISRFTDW